MDEFEMIQILINDISYDSEFTSRAEVEAAIHQEFERGGWQVQLEGGSVPEAADWPVILATIGGAFLLGKPIRENLDAWKDLAKRFNSVLARVSKRFGRLRMDSAACSLLAVDAIVAAFQGQLISLEEVGDLEFRAREYKAREPKSLAHHPDSVFVRLYLVNGETLVVAVGKSSGEITLLHREAVTLDDF